jgi:hypothetical protein
VFASAAVYLFFHYHVLFASAVKRSWNTHTNLLTRAKEVRRNERGGVMQERTAGDQSEPPTVPYSRIFAEAWSLMDLKLIIPASLLSAGLTALQFFDPKLTGDIWDTVSKKGATMTDVWPLMKLKVMIALASYLLNMSTTALFVRAKWNMSSSVRNRLVRILLTRDMDFYDQAKVRCDCDAHRVS